MNVLYLCYQSIADPLTMSQVVAYLEGLASQGHRMFLVTFEARAPSALEQARWERQLGRLGVEWSWLRYHRHPTLPATLWDILAGVATGWRLSRRMGIDLWHARGYVPGVMAVALRHLRGGKFLFDIRGLLAEEYADAGVWRENGWLYWLVKRAERSLVAAADALVVLTERGREWLLAEHGERVRDKPVQVIPCCVDLRRSPGRAPGRCPGRPRLVYVGKLGGWYLTAEMVHFFGVARRVIPGLRWAIFTQSEAAGLERCLAAAGLAGSTSVGQLAPAELVPRLRTTCHVAVCLIRPGRSKLASSPTKIGEYLAAGLPVVLNAGIGDLDRWMAAERVGVVLTALDDSGYREGARQLARMLADPDVAERCRRVARQYLDLEQIGWSRYRAIYAAVGPPAA